jgi:hypothetical protein
LTEKFGVTFFGEPGKHTEDLKFLNQGRTTLFKISTAYQSFLCYGQRRLPLKSARMSEDKFKKDEFVKTRGFLQTVREIKSVICSNS